MKILSRHTQTYHPYHYWSPQVPNKTVHLWTIEVDGATYRVKRVITEGTTTTTAWTYLDWSHTPAPEHIQTIAKNLEVSR